MSVATLTPVELVIARLEALGCRPKQRGNSWDARCPAHEDHNPSLSVGIGEDDRVLVHCQTGCDLNNVLGALGLEMTDLFPPKPSTPEQPKIVATYPYVDEEGQLLFEAVRYQPKKFRQRHPDGHGGWDWNLNGTRRVLYRLPEVLTAVEAAALVWIVEGEKDANALQTALPEGEVATTNPMGAGKWRPEYTDALKGARVMIWADRDTTGRTHALEVAEQLRPVATYVGIVESSRFKDAADHLGAGLNLDDDLVIVDTASPIEEEPDDDDRVQTPAERYRSALLRGLELTRLPPPEPLIDGFLDLDSLALIYGRPKGGKTFVGIDLALCVATGTWWHSQAVTAGRVLYIMAEGAHGASLRLQAWMQHHGIHSDPNQFIALPLATNLLDAAMVGGLTEIATELEPRLIIIDTLNRCMPGTDEGPADMGKAIWALDTLRLATGACVTAIHHSGKDSTKGARGHSSLLGAVDTELEVLNAGDNIVTLRTTAQRNKVEANPRRFTLLPVANSLVIADYNGRLADTDAVTASGRLCLEILDRIASDAGISQPIWRDAAIEAGVGRSNFYEQLKTLHELGETENVGTASRPLWKSKPLVT